MFLVEQKLMVARPGIQRCLYDWVLHWTETPHGFIALALLAFVESSAFPRLPDPLLIALDLALPQRACVAACVCSVSSVGGGRFGYRLGSGLWEGLGQVFFTYVSGFTPEVFALVRVQWVAQGGFFSLPC